MIKLVVFDMAGTVVNENNVVYKTLHQAITGGGVDVSLHQVLALGAGKEKFKAIVDIVNEFAPHHSGETVNQIYSRFVTMLDQAYQDLAVTPIEGAEQLFQSLKQKGVFVVLNTGYKKETATQLLDKLGWTKGVTYDELVTASDVASTRPQPDMIYHAMKLCGITDARTVLKIGDSIIDIEEGKNAGCAVTVGITTGAHTRTQLESANPDYIIDRLPDLLTWIDEVR